MGRQELEFMLACETTGRERYMALALLSGHYNVDLYSTDKETRLPKVHMKGYADYYTQMPLVFSQSKINLNISLKTIKTGIPLRVTDVMGMWRICAFQLSAGVRRVFCDWRGMCGIRELTGYVYKAKYYLEHEEERKRIAMAGLERVKRILRLRTDYIGCLMRFRFLEGIYSNMNEKKETNMEIILKTSGVVNPKAEALADNIRGNIEFMNQLNQAYTYVQVPLKMSGQNANGELYVYTNKKNLRDPDAELSAFFTSGSGTPWLYRCLGENAASECQNKFLYG